MTSQAPPPDDAAVQAVFQLSTGYIASAALQAALRLQIPDRLADGPRPVAELARDAGVREDGLYRILRVLASVGVFSEQAPRTFELTPAAALLRSEPGSLRAVALWMTEPFHFRVYAETMHTLETGQPAADKVAGMPVFEYFSRNRELSDLFNDAMTSFSANVAPSVLQVYDFSGIGTLVDVAGGHGEVLASILREYPQMRGVLFDLDHVVAGATPRLIGWACPIAAKRRPATSLCRCPPAAMPTS